MLQLQQPPLQDVWALHKPCSHACCEAAPFACKLHVPLQRGVAACMKPHVHSSCNSYGQQNVVAVGGCTRSATAALPSRWHGRLATEVLLPVPHEGSLPVSRLQSC